MFKSLWLKKFQSHDDTFIEFDAGVNAFIGLSDSGKTAALRALRWVCFNQPDGDDFISHWADSTEVELVLDSLIVVTRGRGKTGNWYTMQIPGQKLQEFKAFGRGQVPQEIRDALNLNHEINLSRQLDGPFLLSMSPGEVAQTLNRVVNLDIIDIATSNIRKKKQEADRELKSCVGRKSQLEEQLTGFKYLEDMESDIIVLESLNVSVKKIQDKAIGIRGIQKQAQKLFLEIAECSNLLPAGKRVKILLSLVDDVEKQEKGRKELTRIVNQLYDYKDELEAFGNVVKAQIPVETLLARVEELEDKRGQAEGLRKLVRELKITKDKLQQGVTLIQDLEAEFHELMPEQCPLCGQEVQ